MPLKVMNKINEQTLELLTSKQNFIKDVAINVLQSHCQNESQNE